MRRASVRPTVIGPPKEREPFVGGPLFDHAVAFVVIANALEVGLEVDHGCWEDSCEVQDRFAWWLFDCLFALAYCVEAAMRLQSRGFRALLLRMPEDRESYQMVKVWNWLDLALAACSAVDVLIFGVLQAAAPGTTMRTVLNFLRVFRIVRIVKAIRCVRILRKLVVDSGETIHTSAWISVFMLIIIFSGGMFLTVVLGKQAHNYNFSASAWSKSDYWGTVPASMYTLFQMITGDGWDEALIRPIWKRSPALVVLLSLFIILMNLGVLNVLLAEIVKGMMRASARDSEKRDQNLRDESERVAGILQEIFTEMDKDGSGTIDEEELDMGCSAVNVKRNLDRLEISQSDMVELFHLLADADTGEVPVDRFVSGCKKMKGPAQSLDVVQLEGAAKRISSDVDDALLDHRDVHDDLDTVLEGLKRLDREVVLTGDDDDPVLQRRSRYRKGAALKRLRAERNTKEDAVRRRTLADCGIGQFPPGAGGPSQELQRAGQAFDDPLALQVFEPPPLPAHLFAEAWTPAAIDVQTLPREDELDLQDVEELDGMSPAPLRRQGC